MLKNKRSSSASGKERSPKKGSTTDKKHSTSSIKSDRSVSSLASVSSLSPKAPKEPHWIDNAKESVVVLAPGNNAELTVEILGGADVGQFPYVADVPPDGGGVVVEVGQGFQVGDVLLEVQGQKVSGYTLNDVKAWLLHCLRGQTPVAIKTVQKGKTKKDISKPNH